MIKIAIYGSRRQHAYREEIRSLFASLVLGGARLAVAEKLYDHLENDLDLNLSGAERVGACPDDADMAVSIGGDGTFLRTVAWVENRSVPILGINTGHLGYLSAMTLPEAVSEVDRILGRDFRIEFHTLLSVEASGLHGWPMALNEVVVAKEDSSSMINAAVHINNHFLADYKADGLIVATPTGSTAYNLSVGGPIVQPTAPVWVLSPIAAHSLSLRPLVVGDTAELTIHVSGRGRRFRLVLDGRSSSMEMGATVHIRRAANSVAIMQRPDRDFTEILSTKLMFNG